MNNLIITSQFIGSQQTQHVALHNIDLDHVGQLTIIGMKAQRERHHTSYCYGPIVQGGLLTHHPGGGHVDEEGSGINLPSGRVSGRASELSSGGFGSIYVENICRPFVFMVLGIL